MSSGKRSRGRPKGSGIDDRHRLLEIGHLIESHPGLKPTTAIRRLGHSDPSVIRRLRDKYNAQRDSIHTELKTMPAPHCLNDNTSFRLPTEAARQAQLAQRKPLLQTPKEILRHSTSPKNKRNELSCLLAIGAHALAQAAAYCADMDESPTVHDSTDSQAFLAQMLFMMSNPTRGDEANAV